MGPRSETNIWQQELIMALKYLNGIGSVGDRPLAIEDLEVANN